MASLFIIMLFLHILDDFVLQPICLSKLKQKKWWKEMKRKENITNKTLYDEDYICALIIHGLSWSAMVHFPFIISSDKELIIWLSFIIHAIIHAFIDNQKANKYRINLIQDQLFHLIQLFIIFITFKICVL